MKKLMLHIDIKKIYSLILIILFQFFKKYIIMQEFNHQYCCKKYGLIISIKEEKKQGKRKNYLQFILTCKDRNIDPKKLTAKLSGQFEQLKVLFRKFRRYRLISLNLKQKRLTLVEQFSFVFKDQTNDCTKKQIKSLDKTFGMNYWRGQWGSLKVNACVDRNFGQIYLNVKQKISDLKVGEAFISQCEYVKQIIQLKKDISQLKQEFYLIFDKNQKDKINLEIRRKEKQLRIHQENIFNYFKRIPQSLKLKVNWALSNININNEHFPQLRSLTTCISLNPEKNTEKVKLFRHIFLTQLISSMIINQFGRNKQKIWKYRNGRTRYEYEDQQLEELRSCGHRFSSFRDDSISSQKSQMSAEEVYQGGQTSGSDSQESQKSDNILPASKKKIDKKKKLIFKIGKKIKKRMKGKKYIGNFIVIGEEEKSQINRKRYCLHQMTRETDKTSGIINFVQLAFSSQYPKKELLNKQNDNQNTKKKRMSHFLACFKAKKSVISCLREYTRESFFHKVLNIGLRVLKTAHQLTYLRIGFSHVFWSIRTFYQRHKRAIFDLKKNKNQNKIIKVYRGCQMSQQEICLLQKNVSKFIELQGFVSTTLKQQIVNQFITNTKIEIKIPVQNLRGMFDNGFAHVQSCSNHSKQRQVIINAFNLFKITSHSIREENEFSIYFFSLQYGGIKQIEQKVQKNKELIESQFLMKVEENKIKEFKKHLEMKEQRMSSGGVKKLRKQLIEHEKKFEKWRNNLKAKQETELINSLKNLQEWEKEILDSYIHQQKQINKIDNYGQLLIAVGDFRRGFLYLKRMLKKVSHSRALQRFEARKSQCIIKLEMMYRELISECFGRLNQPQNRVDQLHLLKDLYKSINILESENRYIELLAEIQQTYNRINYTQTKNSIFISAELNWICEKYQIKRQKNTENTQNILVSLAHLNEDEIKKKIESQKEKMKKMRTNTYGKYCTQYLIQQYFLVEMLNRQFCRFRQKYTSEEVIREAKEYFDIRSEFPSSEDRKITLFMFKILLRRVPKASNKMMKGGILPFVCRKLEQFIQEDIYEWGELEAIHDCFEECLRFQLLASPKPVFLKLIKTRIHCDIQQKREEILETFIYAFGLLFSGMCLSDRTITREYIKWVRQVNQKVQMAQQETAKFPHSISALNYFNWLFKIDFSISQIIQKWVSIENYYAKEKVSLLEERHNEKQQEKVLKCIQLYEQEKKGDDLKDPPFIDNKSRVLELIPHQHPFHVHGSNTRCLYYSINQSLGEGQCSLTVLQKHCESYVNSQQNTKEVYDLLKRVSTTTQLHQNPQSRKKSLLYPKMLSSFDFTKKINEQQTLDQLVNLKLQQIKANIMKKKKGRQKQVKGAKCLNRFNISHKKSKQNIVFESHRQNSILKNRNKKQEWSELSQIMHTRLYLFERKYEFQKRQFKGSWRVKTDSQVVLEILSKDRLVLALTIFTGFWYAHQIMLAVRSLKTFDRLHIRTLQLSQVNEPFLLKSMQRKNLTTILQETLQQELFSKFQQKQYLIPALKSLQQKESVPSEIMRSVFHSLDSREKIIQLLMNDQLSLKLFVQAVEQQGSNQQILSHINKKQKGFLVPSLFYLSEEQESKKQKSEREKKKSLRYSVLKVLLEIDKLNSYVVRPVIRILGSTDQKERLNEIVQKQLKKQTIMKALINTKCWMCEDWPIPKWPSFQK